MKLRHIPSQIRGWWNHRSGTERLEISFQGVIAFATLTYVTVALFQWCAMREANKQSEQRFAAIQHAAVYLGLPDGTVAKFGERGQGTDQYHSALPETMGNLQRRVRDLEAWVFVEGQPAPTIPPFQGFSAEARARMVVIPMPPGSRAIKSVQIKSSDRKLVEDGKTGLTIEGRISYVDKFGHYCQPFATWYSNAIGEFFVAQNRMKAICPHDAAYTGQ